MKKTFLFLAALAMSAMAIAANHEGNFKKITNAEDFTTGYYVVTGAGTSKALGNTANSNKRIEGVAVSISDNTISNPSTDVVFNITVEGTICTFKNEANGLYMYQASTTSGKGMGFQEAAANITFNGWVSGTGYEGWSFTLNGTSNNIFKWNNSSAWFANYANDFSSSMKPVDLYKLDGGTPTPQRVLTSIYISGTAEKLEYFVGEEFDPAGLKVMGKYDDELGDTEITSGITWSCNPDVFALGNTSVDVTATAQDFTSAPFTVNNIVVKEKVVPTGYAGTYTSNVELTTEGGTSASEAKVIIDGTEYDAIKAGTSSKAGSVVVNIPAATKMLHFHAVGWKDKNVTLDVNGTEYALVADAGISNNSPFTLQGDASDYYYAIDPKGATAITFTATNDYRFVLFGVNAELPEGIVAAPTFSPAVTTFESSVEVSLACETEGADIYYTLDGTDPTNASTKYETPFTLTETTTVKAIAEKDDKTSEVAEKTYVKAVFASLEELVTYMPATKDAVTVTVTLTDVAIDSFYVSSKGYTNGAYVTAASTVVELYTNDVPETWKVGGKISGTIKAQWNLYNGVAELQKWEGGWDAFTYAAPVSEADLVSITLSLDKDTLYQNKEFKYNGTVMANYSDETTKDVTKTATFTGYDMTTLGDQVVTVSYTEGEITKEATYTLTVAEKVAPTGYATTYTSNVDLPAIGTKAYDAQVVVAEGDTVIGLKGGTGSVPGILKVGIPAATEKLHFHAVGWKGAEVKLAVNNDTIDITSEDGISGNSPFTLVGEPYDYYYSIEPNGADTITFEAVAGFRFVLFGVNAELPEGALAAPSFTPSATDFEGSVEVSLACETEGAEIFYALNEEVTSMNAIKYTEPIKLTETTTIYAVAKKDGKESEQVSKTYTAIPVFESLEDLVNNMPATETNVTVIVTITEAPVDSFYVSGQYTNGVYIHVGETAVELYNRDVPETWEVGGKISGTIKAQWGLYKGIAELQKWDGGWEAFTYTAPTALINPKANKVAKKAIVNGQIVIIRDNKAYNVLGF